MEGILQIEFSDVTVALSSLLAVVAIVNYLLSSYC